MERQSKLSDSGIEVPDDPQLGDEDNDRNIEVNDFGDPIKEYETKAGYNIYEVKSLLFKAVRRGDKKMAMWSAYELCRSGADIRDEYWEGVTELAIIETKVEDIDLTKLERLENICKNKWSSRQAIARIAAMKAAKLLAMAGASKEQEYLRNFWKMCVHERKIAREEEREPEFDDFPDLSQYPEIFDQHTYRGTQLDHRVEFWHKFSSNVTDPTDLEKEMEENILRHSDRYEDWSDKEIEMAIEGVERGSWGESQDS